MKRRASWPVGHGRSAEQPADGAPDGSAEQPAHDDNKRRKIEEKGKLQTSVSYLFFPDLRTVARNSSFGHVCASNRKRCS